MDNDHIRIGKHLDETVLKRNRKRLTIAGLCALDYILEGERFEVHEIKKGEEHELAHLYQVLFYLEVLSELTGREDVMGFIHYPEVRRIVTVTRDPPKVERLYATIVEIVNGRCPGPQRIPICNGCSYEEMCWA